MKCPLCNTEAFIKDSRYVVEGDKTDTEEPKLFVEQDMECRNKKCSNYGTIIHTFKNPIKLSQ